MLIPHIYGLPKIHKPDTPLRPIVSFYTSPTYGLSKHLVGILSPLVGKTSSAVRNSREFISFCQSVSLRDEVLISFDVISLFTKIPIDLALEVARERLEDDTTLDDRTILSVDDILSLLSLYVSMPPISLFEVHSTSKSLALPWVPLCQWWWLTLSWNT